MEEKYMKTKKIIIITMCTLICIMAVGYAAFATQLTINGTASIESTWKILFTKIEEVSKTSGVTITNPPTASGTTATFNVDLTSPGDKIVYKITVANQGSLDAVIDKITESETGSDAIKFEVAGIAKGDKLSKGTSTTFNVTISYDSSVTAQPSKINNNLTVSINYIQYVNSTTPDEPTNPNTLVYKILNNNQAQPDTNIDFSQLSSDTNGKGLYYTSTNTENNKVTYYFRGAVENNYVSFAGFDWRIIRINEDGSIRAILNDVINTNAFNDNYDDNAYVGYMYGTAGSLTYAETHKNTNSSTIKTVVDTWYQNNLTSYFSLLADSGFCGDRSVASSANTWDSEDTALGYETNLTYYGGALIMFPDMSSSDVKPQFKCQQSNDLYTTKTATKGNKSLTYPIGLITADEVVYAGGSPYTDHDEYYLYSEAPFWTMTPLVFNDYAQTIAVGYIDHGYNDVHDEWGTKPVINLKSTVEVTEGDGTEDNPYVIKAN